MNKKKLSRKEKNCCLGLIVFFTVALIIGVKSVYAYYYDEPDSKSLFASYVGDFYEARGDLSIDIYTEITAMDGVYKKVDSVPSAGYNEPTVSCTSTNNQTPVSCTKDGTSGCTYTYQAGSITLKSNEAVRCKFYFAN